MPAPKGHTAYNVNGEGGRPKIYTQEFVDNEGAELEKWNQKDDSIFIQKFCLERGYSVHRISEFLKISKRFSEAYEILMTKQQLALFAGGLKKTFAHPMCALILSHGHDINSKTEQKISGDAVNPLAFALTTINGVTKDLVE